LLTRFKRLIKAAEQTMRVVILVMGAAVVGAIESVK